MQQWRHTMMLVGSVVTVVSLLCACGSTSVRSDSLTTGDASAPMATEMADAQAVTLRGCNPQGPLIGASTLDMCGGGVLDAVTATLIRYHPETAEPQLDIASSITTQDNQHFTIRLKPQYLFGDGSEVTASSFVNAWNWAAYRANAQPNAFLFEPILGYEQVQGTDNKPPTARIMSGLKVVDRYTFTITTTYPVSNLVTRLGYTAFAPMPTSFFTDTQAYGLKPITAGPYQVQSWSAGNQIVLRRFTDYSGDWPGHTDTIIFRMYRDAGAAYKDVLAGNLDATNDLPASALLDEQFKRDFPGRWQSKPVGTNSLLTFAPRSTDPSVADPRLRQALSMAISRDAISKQLFAGTRVPATGWVPPVVDGYRANACGSWCTFNPDAARKLLAQAGGYSGTLSLSYNADSDNKPWITAVCNDIKTQLGIDCAPSAVPDLRSYRSLINDHQMQGMFRKGWQMDYPSIENFLTPLYATGGVANDSGYSNPEFDALLRKAAAARSHSAANELYRRAERLLGAGMPSIPLFNLTQPMVWGNKISHAQLTIKGTFDVASIRIAPAASPAS